MIYGSILCIAGDSELPGRTEMAAAELSRLAVGRLILLYVLEKCYNSDFLVTDSPGWKSVHEMCALRPGAFWTGKKRRSGQRDAIR